MKILVTGATSGIGRAVITKLLSCGHEITGVGRDFEKYPIENDNYTKYFCDFRQMRDLEKLLQDISKIDWDIVILSAGLGYFSPHEEIHFAKIQEMVQVNLTSAMMISQAVLRRLKKTKGKLFFISSVTATKSSPIGAAYSATKAGLSHFADSLWSEVRKYGVQVSVLEPDMTKTNFYVRTSFDVSEEEEGYLYPEEIAETIVFMLEQRSGVNIRRIEIQPQKHKITRKG